MREARAARELAETRAALLADLERKNRELEAFGYSVSHDLRTPLRAIHGLSLALIEEYEQHLDERGRDWLRHVHGAARRMGELIDDLLALSRIGRGEFARQPVDLTALASDIAASLARAAPDHPIRCEVADGLRAQADPRLVKVLLENLLGNAWKFTARSASPVVAVGCEPGGVFFVRDNGAGFDMAQV